MFTPIPMAIKSNGTTSHGNLYVLCRDLAYKVDREKTTIGFNYVFKVTLVLQVALVPQEALVQPAQLVLLEALE